MSKWFQTLAEIERRNSDTKAAVQNVQNAQNTPSQSLFEHFEQFEHDLKEYESEIVCTYHERRAMVESDNSISAFEAHEIAFRDTVIATLNELQPETMVWFGTLLSYELPN